VLLFRDNALPLQFTFNDPLSVDRAGMVGPFHRI